MKVRELIEILNVYGVSINYDTIENFKLDSPIYFAAVNDKERKKYEASKDKTKFISTTAAIHIPDLTLSDLMEILKSDGTGIYEHTKKQLLQFFRSDVSENIVFATYLFLHEVGHWYQFAKIHMNVELWFNENIELYKDNYDKIQQIAVQRQQRLMKDPSCNLTFREKHILESLRGEYRNIPKEKDADTFAIKNLESALYVYTNYRS
ncbi:hypothetical protein [Paenibacillus sp. NPDC093718]|uniref:hypothetical protein n=1 Tax=Paenibacillus sp. NPDC093718 TaxID=3390601 RepID=UPI003CFFE899